MDKVIKVFNNFKLKIGKDYNTFKNNFVKLTNKYKLRRFK